MSATEAHAAEDATGIRKRFRPLLEIGRGGMAQVFLAESVSFDVRKLVVLKILNSEFAAHAEMRSAFRREADISARMNHPNVVQVFEVVEHAGQTIIVMEYLEGLPLSRILRQTRIPLVLHLDILSQVLGGLHHFHELQDIDDSPLNAVHRDVSPQNVVLLHEGVAKVLDFGVAKFTAGDPEHTRTGLIKGKIQYMPPEQLLGDAAVDRRADIFALGAMMWEALAGRRMWHGLAERDVMRALARGEIPALRAVVPEVAPELEAVVNQALHPDADQRFQTAKDMQSALEQVMPATVGVAHSRDLAAFMKEHFGEARKLQKTKVDAARRDPSADLGLNTYRPPSVSDLTVAEPSPAGGTSKFPVSAEPPPPAPASPLKRASFRRLSALVLALGASGLAFGVYSARSVKPVSQAPVAAHVQFHVLTHPADAEIWLDGALLAAGKYQGTRASSDREHRLLARATGYKPREESIRFDADVVRLIRLERIASPATATATATETGLTPATVAEELERGKRWLGPAAKPPKVTELLERAASASVESGGRPSQPGISASANAETPPPTPVETPKTTGLTSLLPTAAPKEAPPRAKQVSPKIGHALLAVDVSSDPYRVRLPPALARMAGTLESLVKICVTPAGTVSSVAVVRSADPALDQKLTSTIPSWRYRPLIEDSRAIPFCYTTNLRFEGRRN